MNRQLFLIVLQLNLVHKEISLFDKINTVKTIIYHHNTLKI